MVRVRIVGVVAVLVGVWAGATQAQIPPGPILMDAPQRAVTRTYDRAALLEDLRHLDRTVRATAPEGAPLPDTQAVEALIAAETQALPEAVSRRQIATAVMRVAGAYRSSHIYVLTPHEDWTRAAEAGARQMDRAMSLGSDGVLQLEGRAVDSLNGRPARQFVGWARATFDTHNPLRLPERVRDRGAEMLWLWGLEGPFDVVFADGTHETFEGRAMVARNHLLAGRSGGGGATAASEAPFVLDIEAGVAHLTVTRLDQRFEADWEALVARLDDGIRSGGVQQLIVDLRGNPGGSGRLSARLLEVLAGTTLPTSGGKRWKRSREYEAGLADFVPQLLRLGPWRRAILGADGVAALDTIPWGETRQFGGVVAPESTPALPTEAVQVLIDQGTGSSATQLARAVQVFGLGRLIGAPTSDGTTALGEIAFFRLPNSRLIFASPSAEFLDVTGQRTQGPVMPDVLLCDAAGLFAADRALDVATGSGTPDTRLIEGVTFRPEASEGDYCAG